MAIKQLIGGRYRDIESLYYIMGGKSKKITFLYQYSNGKMNLIFGSSEIESNFITADNMLFITADGLIFNSK